MSNRLEYSSQIRDTLRQSLIGFPEGLRKSPSKIWWRVSYKFIRRFEQALIDLPPEVSEHFSHTINVAKQMLTDNLTLNQVNSNLDDSDIEHTTGHSIYTLSRLMSDPFCDELPNSIEQHAISIEELVNLRPDVLKLSQGSKKSKQEKIVHVKNTFTKQTYSFPLPPDENIYYKGGIARLMLNFLANAPEKMTNSEIPWNDLDVIVTGNPHEARIAAKELGVDPDGIETLEGGLNFTEYCLGRDVDHNQVLVSANELFFTDEAYRAAQTGNISITGVYTPNRALYGTDIFFHKGVMMSTPRGLMRLVKPLVEGKAMSFSIRPANGFIDMSPYFLFLARKWSSKEAFPILLQRLMEVGKKIGQVPLEETDPLNIIKNMHIQYPLFDLGASVQSERDVAIWKAGKLIRQADREFTWKFNIPGVLSIPNEILDDPPILISIDDFIPDPELSNHILKYWNSLELECHERTEQVRKNSQYDSNRYFLKNEAWLRLNEDNGNH